MQQKVVDALWSSISILSEKLEKQNLTYNPDAFIGKNCYSKKQGELSRSAKWWKIIWILQVKEQVLVSANETNEAENISYC